MLSAPWWVIIKYVSIKFGTALGFSAAKNTAYDLYVIFFHIQNIKDSFKETNKIYVSHFKKYIHIYKEFISIFPVWTNQQRSVLFMLDYIVLTITIPFYFCIYV